MRKNGFTLIEILAVLFVLFVLSAVVASRYTPNTNDLLRETEALKSSLRYAQSKSLADDTATWGIKLNDEQSYSLYKNGSPSTFMIPVKNPHTSVDSGPVCQHSLPQNVTIATGAGTLISFDKWGKPGTGAFTITLSQGSASASIRIYDVSGYIP